ncbi:MAG: histidine kinase dimerization/phospho-acceptor domain-containing protein [Nitrososphaeraceae archaeon]
MAAHELRTPIEPNIMGSEQLKSELPNKEIVSIIFRNAKNFQTLAYTILDAARIESGTFKLYKGCVNIKDIISDALQIAIGSSCYKAYEPEDIFIEAE